MANLSGNISKLVKVQGDKRDQLPPKQSTKESQKKEGEQAKQKRGQKSLCSSNEPHIATRLLLPESLKEEFDRYFFERKLKGKNEFLIEAVRNHLKAKKKSEKTT